MMAAPQEKSIEATHDRLRVTAISDDRCVHPGVGTYRMLTGTGWSSAVVEDDRSFDRHVLACILAIASMDRGSLAAGVGLAAADLAGLIAQWFPDADKGFVDASGDAAATPDDEAEMVHELLQMQRSTDGEVGRWLAAMVARRAIEPNHLWEDLGLRDRSELTRLLLRHFAPLAGRNTQNMRWKRFFYRMLCEQDGFAMCTTPVCTNCHDFDVCFGDESGESRMADRRREVSLQVVLGSPPESSLSSG